MRIFSKVTYFFFLLSVLVLPMNILLATSMERFVQKYMETRGIIRRQQQLVQGQEESLKFLDQFYSARLKANIDSSIFDFKFPGDISYDINQNNFGLSFDQEFATGTVLSVGGDFRHADRSDRDDNQQNFDFDIRLSQSLKRNWLGKLNSSQLRVTKSENQIEYLKEKKRVILSCLKASELYINSYFASQRNKVVKERADDALSIKKDSSRKFEKKLIDKLGYLQSIVDHQQSAAQFLESQQGIELFNKELRLYDRAISIQKIKKPQLLKHDDSYINKDDFSNRSLDYEQRLAQLAFFQSQADQIRAQNTWDLSLEAFLGASQKRNDFSFSNVGDNERDNLGVGLKLDIPLYDSSLKSRLKRQMVKLKGQELNLAELKIDLEFEKERYFSQIKQNSKRVVLLKSQLKKLQELIREAKRKFEIRKITFDRYLNFRNQLFARKLELIRVEQLNFVNALEFMKQFSLDPGYCYE